MILFLLENFGCKHLLSSEAENSSVLQNLSQSLMLLCVLKQWVETAKVSVTFLTVVSYCGFRSTVLFVDVVYLVGLEGFWEIGTLSILRVSVEHILFLQIEIVQKRETLNIAIHRKITLLYREMKGWFSVLIKSNKTFSAKSSYLSHGHDKKRQKCIQLRFYPLL